MSEDVKRVAAALDAKRDLLKQIREISPAFYNEFRREFLTDPLTLTNFEKDLVNALQAIAGITIYTKAEDFSVWVQHRVMNGAVWNEELDSFESALYFAIGLLHINPIGFQVYAFVPPNK